MRKMLNKIMKNFIRTFKSNICQEIFSYLKGLSGYIKKEKFGRHDIPIHSHLNNLLNIECLESSSGTRGLRNLYDKCLMQIQNLEPLDLDPHVILWRRVHSLTFY